MRVLINALSVKEGGSIVVLSRLLEAMSSQDRSIDWWVVAMPSVVPFNLSASRVSYLSFPWAERSALHLLYWYNFTLPNIVRKFCIDVLFSQTNYLPHRSVACPTLLLEQHAGHFSDIYKVLYDKENAGWRAKAIWGAKTIWVHRSVQRATKLIVQTEALADEVARQAGVPRHSIEVIPHGTGLLSTAARARRWHANPIWRIGYVTKPGVQKNFGVVLRAMNNLIKINRRSRLLLSLSPDNLMCTKIIEEIEKMNLSEYVENIGDRPMNEITRVYDVIDIFVFPSLCESFGFPLVEAMAVGLPVLIADTPGNCEVAGSAGLVFSGNDDASLADSILKLMTDEQHYNAYAGRSLDRSRAFSWARSGQATIDVLYRLAKKTA